MKPIAILTTTASRDEARNIARALVERKLAACVQISGIESVYSWQGEVQEEKEFRLLVKTTSLRYEAVESVIRSLHSYELPAIYSIPVDQAYAPYAQWIADNSAAL